MKDKTEAHLLELIEIEKAILTLELELDSIEIESYQEDFYKNVFIHYLK